MTLDEAMDRAGAIWIGLPISVKLNQAGGCDVEVYDDNRTHGLDRHGHVTCKHQNCITREDKAR